MLHDAPACRAGLQRDSALVDAAPYNVADHNTYLSGVGIKQLQSLLRHSSVQITDIYLKSLGLRTDPNIENYNW